MHATSEDVEASGKSVGLKSLTNSRNRNGPRRNPWDTPDVTGSYLEEVQKTVNFLLLIFPYSAQILLENMIFSRNNAHCVDLLTNCSRARIHTRILSGKKTIREEHEFEPRQARFWYRLGVLFNIYDNHPRHLYSLVIPHYPNKFTRLTNVFCFPHYSFLTLSL